MKRTLYPKLLAGYLMYGLIGFLIITTFTYHITFAFVEKKEAASLYRESALISSNYAGNYFSKTMTLDEIQTQLSTLSTYLSSEIWIVDTRGSIILNTAAPGCDPTPVPGFNITDFGSRYYQTGTFYNQFTSETVSYTHLEFPSFATEIAFMVSVSTCSFGTESTAIPVLPSSCFMDASTVTSLMKVT